MGDVCGLICNYRILWWTLFLNFQQQRPQQILPHQFNQLINSLVANITILRYPCFDNFTIMAPRQNELLKITFYLGKSLECYTLLNQLLYSSQLLQKTHSLFLLYISHLYTKLSANCWSFLSNLFQLYFFVKMRTFVTFKLFNGFL